MITTLNWIGLGLAGFALLLAAYAIGTGHEQRRRNRLYKRQQAQLPKARR